MRRLPFALALFLLLPPLAARAADYPAPREADYDLKDFRFHGGEVFPTMRVHYATIGDPKNPAVLVLHGTGGSGTGLLSPSFAGELFGPGQALDATKYFIVLPDAIGTGKSSKPSDGLRAAFPRYNYRDMVEAQRRLLTEGLGITRLRMVIGNSMGGMEVFVWGTTQPDFAELLVPMAAQPTAMAARNWMMRRLLVEAVRQDPEYKGGNYTVQPSSLRLANAMYATSTNGGTLAYQEAAPTTAKADELVERRLAEKPPADANDFIWQWGASFDYDPEPMLNRITVPLLLINAADDERNPPETGVTARAMAKLGKGETLLIPASAETRGHGTTGFARFWAPQLKDWMERNGPKP